MLPTADTVQVIVGLRADEIASAMCRAAEQTGGQPAASGRSGTSVVEAPAHYASDALIHALGGPDNVGEIETLGTRLSVSVNDAARVDEQALIEAGFRGLARIHSKRVQVLMSGPDG